MVAVEDLSIEYSPRETVVDDDHVRTLMEVIDFLPPVVVDRATMTLIDGVHRLEAFRRSGRSHIQAVFFSGDDSDVRAVAVRANIKHGKPLTRGERQAAAMMLLDRSPERSDRWLGEICGLSHSTVARLRTTSQGADAATRVGRDGRRRPTDPEAGRAEVAKTISENPSASVRETAEAAGVAPSTAQRAGAGSRRPGAPSRPAPPPAGRTVSDPVAADAAFGSSPELAEVVSWMSRTAVTADDFGSYLERVPLGRIYEVADECRRRSATWAELATSLEKQVRPKRTTASS
jgi:ParB-like chromosome segregation protein Spo0J